jgi:hypothetical protein
MDARRACGVVACAAVFASLSSLASVASAKQPAVMSLLDLVANADDAPYRAKQLVVYFGERESAAVLDVRSSPEGRFVRAESGRDVTRMWTDTQDGTTQVGVHPKSVLAKYALATGARETHLGVELIPLTLTRRKDAELAERWWIHEKTGVVYKRELFGGDGDLVGLATLTEMHWNEPGPAEPVEIDAVDAPSVTDADAPRAAPDRLAGGYELWRAYDLEVDGRPAEQWVYSDGLHALSVFRTKGHLATPDGFTQADVGGQKAWAGPGPGTWAFEGSDHSFLVVAEEAGIDPGQLLEPFPRGGGASFWERLGSVWSRLFRAVGSLFD